MIDVFISYKREDRLLAEQLASFLKNNGYTVWWDAELLSGDSFITEIFEVLKTAKSVVVLWSDAALSSRFVVGEALFSLSHGDNYIGAALTPNILLPPPFNSLHYIDVSLWESNPSVFLPLLPAIERHVGAIGKSESKVTPLGNEFEEVRFWQDVSNARKTEDYQFYLSQYGESGIFSNLAKQRIEVLLETNKQPNTFALPKMISIPVGTFEMGGVQNDTASDEDERPVHLVTIKKSFRMSIAPISFEEYDAFCIDTDREFVSDNNWGRGKLPVINVSWSDANAFCNWLSVETGGYYRLPSEAEWEYASRGGSSSVRYWGSFWDASKANGAVSVGKTSMPGNYNSNPFGLLDMIGNIWEWCADPLHDGYCGAPNDGSVWSKSGNDHLRIIRGGSWDDLPQALRCSMRGWYHRNESAIRLGFRVVQEEI